MRIPPEWLDSTRWPTLLFALLTATLALAPFPLDAHEGSGETEPFFLQGGERIVFFGDSITQGGLYVEYIDAFLATRFPEAEFTVINHGISSETISGTSEEDHDPRRPDAKTRFARDVAAWEPDVVVACFGMNDGNYHPPNKEKFAAYRSGVEWLIDQIDETTDARLTLLTPPPFDPYRRKNSDPEATAFGYKYPAVDYDETLEMYADYLTSLRGPDLVVGDVHTALNEHLRLRREEEVSFFLSGDAVHPGATGHWLMAMELLEAWGAPSVASEVRMDLTAEPPTLETHAPQPLAVRAATADGPPTDTIAAQSAPIPTESTGSRLREVKATPRGAEFTWTARLPMPIDPRWDMKSVRLAETSARVNRHRMQIVGFEPEAEYLFFADGEPIAKVTGSAFAKGVDLTLLPAFPTTKRAVEVLALIQQRQKLIYTAWRRSLPNSKTGEPGDDGTALAEAAESVETLTQEIRDLCQPRDVHVRIVRASKATE